MTSYAPAPDIETAVEEGVAEIRAEGKRRPSQKLDLSDPRQISKEVVVALARKIAPDLIAEKIEALLHATRPTKYGEAADVRAMEAGIKLYLAYAVGLPTQRQEIVTVNLEADNSAGIEARLANSPALLRSMEAIIERVRGRAVEAETMAAK